MPSPQSLDDTDRRLVAAWAVECAERVLPLFEAEQPDDQRPREAIEAIRTWVDGGLPMMRTRAAGGHAMGAARHLQGAARFAAYAAGQAAVVSHVAEHDLGAAAYAIKAAVAAAPAPLAEETRRRECRWQRDRLPDAVHTLVLEDQQRRNAICWNVFD